MMPAEVSMRTFVLESEVEVTAGATRWTVATGGARLALRTGDRIEVRASDGLAPLHEIRSPAIASAAAWAISPDGTLVALAESQQITLLDAEGEVQATASMPDGVDTPKALAWSADGTRLWASTELGEDPDVDGDLVTHVFLLSAPALEILGRGYADCAFEEQGHRMVPEGERCLFAIGCGQDGTWVYTVAPSADEGKLDVIEVAPDMGLCDMCGLAGDVVVALGLSRAVRARWPGRDVIDEHAFPEDAALAHFGAMDGGIALVSVGPGARPTPLALLALDAATGALVARGDDLGTDFLGAAPGGRAIHLASRDGRMLLRVHRLA
jgi:hypothetical protein